MKRAYFICLFLCLTATFLLSQSNPVPLVNQTARVVPPISVSQAGPQAQARILDGYGKLPLSFEANHGQADARVKFLSRTGGYSLFLTGDEAVLALSGKKSSPQGLKPASLAAASGTAEAVPFPRTIHGTSSRKNDAAADRATGGVLRMKLRNANAAAKVTGLDELAGTSNYFIGNDPAKWRTNVPRYAKVKYEGIYSGIDLVYYGNQRQLEYDFIVAPGADPRRIAFDVRGAKRIRQDGHGDLVLKMSEGEIRWHKPVVYQEKDGARQEIAAHYAITATNRVGLALAKYDARRVLYIDPLIYSTYLGGSGDDFGAAIAVDSAGNAYVTGFTTSTDFPTMNPLQAGNGGGYDAFVAKINPAGSALVYCTYLGGGGNEDYPYPNYFPGWGGIAVDSAGDAYVTGSTTSTNFPTMNPLQPANSAAPNPTAFVAKLNPTGSALVYSTYLGGSDWDQSSGIAVDTLGNAYVAGMTWSTDFPVTPGAFQTTNGGNVDVFVSAINPTGSALIYSTFLGGSANDHGWGIAVDSAGNAYVTGQTVSSDFPTMNPLQPANDGLNDVFVAKLNPTGSALIYSTYIGGTSQDAGFGIAVDSAGNAYVAGSTWSTDFPTMNPLQPTYGGGLDAFVVKIDPTGSALVYSTYLGGSKWDVGQAIAVDSAGNAYVTGQTYSHDFPADNPVQKKNAGGLDAFVSKLNSTGSALVYSTYLGGSGNDQGNGIAVDSAGNAYVTGSAGSTNFPTMKPLQGAYGGSGDAFVSKLNIVPATTTALTSSPNPSAYGQAVTFTAVVNSKLGAPPDGETVSFMKGTTVLGTGALSGGSASFTTSTLPAGTDSIKAVYGGDSNFLGSTSKAVSQVVSKATTTTALASSLNPSKVGQSVTFTASVVPEFSGTVKGTVTFYDGTAVLKTRSLSGGVAKFTTTTLTSGTHSITATYNGSISFTGSSASLTQTVN